MSPKRAGWCFLLISITMLFGGLSFSLAMSAEPMLRGIVPRLIASQSMLVLPMLACAFLTPAPFREMLPVRRIRFSSFLLTVAATVLIYPAIIVINLITLVFTSNRAVEIGIEAMDLPLWASILLIGIFGPFCEELVFRGYLLRNLSASGRTMAACFVSALLFAVAHGNMNQAAYAFFFGVFLAMLARAAGSVTAGFISHALFNSFEVIVMYSFDDAIVQETGSGISLIDILQAQGISGMEWIYVIIAAVVYSVFAVILAVLAFLIIIKVRKIEERAGSAVDADNAAEEGNAIEAGYAVDAGYRAGHTGSAGSAVRTEHKGAGLITAPLIASLFIMAVAVVIDSLL